MLRATDSSSALLRIRLLLLCDIRSFFTVVIRACFLVTLEAASDVDLLIFGGIFEDDFILARKSCPCGWLCYTAQTKAHNSMIEWML
jgi:hypothetical protein